MGDQKQDVKPEILEVIIDDKYHNLLNKEVIGRIIHEKMIESVLNSEHIDELSLVHSVNAADAVLAYIEEVLYDRH